MSQHPVLSRRAIKLLHRLYEGEFYFAYAKNTPKVMKELFDAGLVGSMGRVVTMAACYVPKGAKPPKLDTLPRKPKWLIES
jgi:hypothetical protein